MNEFGFNVFDLHISTISQPLFCYSSGLSLSNSGDEEYTSEDFTEDNIDNTPNIGRDGSSSDTDYSQQIEYIQNQLNQVNENIVTTNENLKLGTSFLFVFCVYFMVKIAFGIFNKFFGLNQL